MHAEMVLILFATLIVSQIALVKWKQIYPHAYHVRIESEKRASSVFENGLFTFKKNLFISDCHPDRDVADPDVHVGQELLVAVHLHLAGHLDGLGHHHAEGHRKAHRGHYAEVLKV